MTENILIVSQRGNSLQEAITLSKACIDTTSCTPYIFCREPSLVSKIPSDIKLLGNTNSTIESLARKVSPNNTKKTYRSTVKELASSFIKRNFLTYFIYQFLFILKQHRLINRTYNDTKFSALIIFEDRSIESMCWIRLAKQRGIKTILLTFASSSTESDIFVRIQRKVPTVPFFAKPILKAFYPQHLKETSIGTLTFYRLSEMLALYFFGYLNTNPWVFGGGETSHFSVSSEEQKQQALKDGVYEHKVVVTGQASFDLVYQSYCKRNETIDELIEKYNLNKAYPFVICAVPHYFEEGILDKDTHLEHTLLLFKSLNNIKANILLSLHPKSNSAYYTGIIEQNNFNLTIATEQLNSILPASKIFVASYSSTMRWAVMLGIPSVIIDSIERNYNLFNQFRSIKVVYNSIALEDELNTLLMNKLYYSEKSNIAHDEAKFIGLCDGQSCERIISLACVYNK